MQDVVWKSFKLGDIIQRKTPPSTNVPAKNLEIRETYEDGLIALVTRAEKNNGIRGYIKKGEFSTAKNAITYNDQFALFLYHDYEFTTIKDHISIVEASNEKFKALLEENSYLSIFIVTILNHIYSKKIFGFNFTGADYKFDREIILLPCLEVSTSAESIWEEEGKYYTLAVDYIKELMDSAKALREQKTIKAYEAERARYEAEYKREKERVVWKSFKLGELFDRSTKLAISANQKDLNLSKENFEGSIALISASRSGNGCVGYLDSQIVDSNKISINKITFDDQWGFTYFQQEPFVITGGHNSILEVSNSKLKELLDGNLFCYQFISKMINKITIKSEIFGYGYKINNKFDREIILLPCLEVSTSAESIWEEEGKYYTLATSYISYLYLSGRVNYNQKLVDNYTYQY